MWNCHAIHAQKLSIVKRGERQNNARLFPFLVKLILRLHQSLSHRSPSVSYKRVSKNSAILREIKLGVSPSYKSVLFDDTFPTFYTSFADSVSQHLSRTFVRSSRPQIKGVDQLPASSINERQNFRALIIWENGQEYPNERLLGSR